ncbi:MAG: helix-turn-helix transcriptional regulator [bacterium]|nr:helix-turn-helix transcriptional regulator [bacterium]
MVTYTRMTGATLYKRLGEKIITERKKKKLSQEDLALLSDIDRTYLARIEEGKANPSLRILHKIARKLKLQTYELLTEA